MLRPVTRTRAGRPHPRQQPRRRLRPRCVARHGTRFERRGCRRSVRARTRRSRAGQRSSGAAGSGSPCSATRTSTRRASTRPQTRRARRPPIRRRCSADVRAALRRADVAVCFFHWGVELHAQPDSRQKELATACLRAGAALVLGAHPARLRPHRPAEPAHARSLDTRQLRLSLGRRDGAHRHPSGEPRHRRRRGLRKDGGNDRGIPAGSSLTSFHTLSTAVWIAQESSRSERLHPSTDAPSGAPATMADSPANGQKRPVHKGHTHRGWP